MGPDNNQDGVAMVFDYSSYSSTLIVDNLRCTMEVPYVGVVNVLDPMHVPEFEKWATVYDSYETAISDFVRTGYWPVLLATSLYVEAAQGALNELHRYQHPPKAVYIVGPDSAEPEVYKRLYALCNDVVTIPSDDRELYAVSALAITLWDRYLKTNFPALDFG